MRLRTRKSTSYSSSFVEIMASPINKHKCTHLSKFIYMYIKNIYIYQCKHEHF